MKAAEHGLAGQTNQETILKMIMDREQMCLEYRYLCNILKSMQSQSITSIAISKQNGTIEILTNPTILTNLTEIHEAIINQNVKHFTRPEASLLRLGKFLHQVIRQHGTSDFSNRIIHGCMTPKDEKNIELPETKELLHLMKTPHQPPEHSDHWITEVLDLLLEPDLDHPSIGKYFSNNTTQTTRYTKPSINQSTEKISTHIGPKDFIQDFKHWEKTKASSPPGRHIGHYKVLTEEPYIVVFFCKMLHLPIKYGFDPIR